MNEITAAYDALRQRLVVLIDRELAALLDDDTGGTGSS